MQFRSCAVVLTCLVLLSSATLLHAQPGRLSLADLIEQSEPSCVRLYVRLRSSQAIGSGFIVENSNWVVTNYHVVAGALQATGEFADDTRVEVEGLLAFDKRRDVAVLKLQSDRKVKPLKLADELPRKGEAAIAIGASPGLSFTAAEGIISAIRDGKELKEYGNDADGTWLQTSTPISPGSPSQSEQAVCSLPAERRFRHRYKIGKEEDEFDKVVWIRTQWLPLKHNDRRQ